MTTSPFDIRILLDPAVYPWPVDEVELIETHISWVLLAGDRVVKLKKPVDLGFVDFRDPAARKAACENEVRLNRRLTTEVYLTVIPIGADGVDGSSEPLEWATLMRRMPADRMLDVLLSEGEAPANLAELLAGRLIPFHQPPPRAQSRDRSQGAGVHPARAGGAGDCPTDPDIYLSVLTDNLDQLASIAGTLLGTEHLQLVDRSMRAFMDAERAWLESRLQHWLGEGHGDLRCEHICLEPNALQIYDCVEFEIAIRCADVASDLAFLLMDLRRLGAGSVADALLARYRAAGFDLPDPVVHLYAAHRALVRAKVAVLARSGNDPERDLAHAFEAAAYLDLASAFATPVEPMLVLISGLSGSGKSTVAASAGRITGGTVLASDLVRKELAGLDPAEPAPAEWHAGIYSGAWTARTYDRLLESASAQLDRGSTVVVDATFLDNAERERFVAAARARNVPAFIVWTELDNEIARERIERRALARQSPSDATFAIRERQIEQMQQSPLRIPDGSLSVAIDTSCNGPASLDPFFMALQQHGLIGSLRQEATSLHA